MSFYYKQQCLPTLPDSNKAGKQRLKDMQPRAPALPAWNLNDGISIQDLCMCLNVD